MLYHSQYGDLHAPGIGMEMGLGATLPLPTSDDGVQAMVDIHGPQQTAQPRESHNFNPFAPHQSFALHRCSHQPSGLESINALRDEFPAENGGIDTDTKMDDYSSSQQNDMSMSAPLQASSEK